MRQLLENALELDPGRYVRGGSADVLLYAVRLAMRVEGFARFLLSTEADTVRGLRTPGVSANRAVLEASAADLQATLLHQIVPLLLAWYARCRRDADTPSACVLAAHIAFAYDAIAAGDSAAAEDGSDATAAADSADSAAASGAEAAPSHAAQQARVFALLSSRVYINVHHDFGLEPRLALPGQKEKASKRSATVGSDEPPPLGFEPLDLFDLWQRSLGGTMAWLKAHPTGGSEVMDNVVRLLSGEKVGGRAAEAPPPLQHSGGGGGGGGGG